MSRDSVESSSAKGQLTAAPPFGLMDRDRVFDFLVEYPTRESIADTKHGNILYLEDISVSFDGSYTPIARGAMCFLPLPK